MIKSLTRVAGFAIKRPKTALAAWGIFTLGLVAIGGNVASVLTDSDLIIPGSASGKAQKQIESYFGDSVGMVIMLKGSPGDLRSQGTALARRIERLPRVRVINPWLKDSPRSLRKNKKSGLLIVKIDSPIEQAMHETLPAAQDAIKKTVKSPTKAYTTGTPPLAAALVETGYGAAQRAEQLAAPFLLLILLIVFRSPIAALIPALFGFAVINSGNGVLMLLGQAINLDTLALSLMSMIGLALGVDYTLLVVSRFRDEIRLGRESREAATVALGTAGRTVIFGGSVLIVAMTLAMFVTPGTLLVSASVGMIGATVLSLIAAVTALPAALVLLGPNIDRWRFGKSDFGGRAILLARRAVKNPILTVALVTIPMLAIAIPASAVHMGIPSVDNLPKDSRAKRDFDQISKEYGPGWSLPFEIIAISKHGPMTDVKRLRALDRFERKLARIPGVESVIGPGVLAQPAGKSKDEIGELDSGLASSERGAGKLHSGLEEAAGNSGSLQAGAQQVASGAGELDSGLASSVAGLTDLSNGLGQTSSGSKKLNDALGKTHAGATKVSAAALEALYGADEIMRPAKRLASGLQSGQSDMSQLSSTAQDAQNNLSQALDSLNAMSVASKADPQYRSVLEKVATAQAMLSGTDPTTGRAAQANYKGMSSSVATAAGQNSEAASGAGQIADGAAKLEASLRKLRKAALDLQSATGKSRSASGELEKGLGRLSSGSSEAVNSSRQLQAGAQSLAAGGSELSSGSQELSSGLSSGSDNSSKLAVGLGDMQGGVSTLNGEGSNGSLGPADSGYFVMAGLDTASDAQKQNSNLVVNLDKGGSAARITVIASPKAVDGGKDTLSPKLDDARRQLERELGVETALGGRAATMRDFRDAANGRAMTLIFVLLASTFVLLVVVFRSLLLALKAVVLNSLTVGAAFGVLVLLYQGSNPIMGGPGYLDIISFYGIYAIVFALSMDYEIFLISRMREGYLKSGSNDYAIEYGIDRTAGIITGAAAIMTAVFGAFAVSGVGQLTQFGIGLTIAVIADATVIRLALLPATMRLLGNANWWLPRWLDRILPAIDLEGEGTEPDVDRPKSGSTSIRPGRPKMGVAQ